MKVIHKPEQVPTTVISVRVEASLKKDWPRAREKAERDRVDMTAMCTEALSEVVRSILGTSSSKASTTSLNGSNGTTPES
jgi:hypothetical protein